MTMIQPPTPERLRTQPWFVRLDEWQHTHQPPFFGMGWYWLWRPLCNLAERHHWKGIDKTTAPSLTPTYSTGTAATFSHTVITGPHGVNVSCTVQNCPICKDAV